jgi:hypothetical protein
MPQVTCEFCRLPFRVRSVAEGATYFCCSGCALAARIPIGADGQLPVSRALVAAVALGFGLFNQALFGVLGLASMREGRIPAGETFTLVSLVVGAFAAAAAVGFAVLPGTRRWTDAAVAVGALAVAAWSGLQVAASVAAASLWLLAVNTLLATWLARGWLRRLFARGRNPAQE